MNNRLPIKEFIESRPSFEECEGFFAPMSPLAVTEMCRDVISVSFFGYPQSLNFYLAAIKRMRDAAAFSVLLNQEQRGALRSYSDIVLAHVEEVFANRPETLIRARAALDSSNALYDLFGKDHIRAWLLERGLYDENGVQLTPVPEGLTPPSA